MAIERNNILSLIGGNRYHSCILTTFSFDFYFFELKVMKVLRSCGIRNINVFIDGHYYSELMQQATGDEMQFSTGYILYPIFEQKVFHPKIWMFFGEKEGLLIIGSGNLTNSGNGSNDEIWGTYHFNLENSQNAPIFSTAWKYLSTLTVTAQGITSEKTTKWITEYSQWLLELPQIKEFEFNLLPDNNRIALLYNTTNSTIWKEVQNLIGNDEITEIISISPFYNEDGKALNEIKNRFPKAKFSVIIDEEGFIPVKLSNSNNFTFYDWKELNISRNSSRSIGNERKSKLHAKILYFKTKDNIEYCLFGSANITTAGLGISNNPNAEISLFVKSENDNILKRIGIILNNSRQLSSFIAKGTEATENKIITNNDFEIKLLAAESNYSTLTLYSKNTYEKPVTIAFFDNNNQFITTKKLEILKSQQEITTDFEDNSLKYIQIQNNESDPISNKIIVSNFFSISKTHPNPQNAKLEQLCGQLQNGELRNVIDLLHYAIIDETEKETGTLPIKTNGGTPINSIEDKNKSQPLDNLSNYNQNKNSHYKESNILLSNSLRVLDAIKWDKNNNKTQNIDTDEQVEDIEKSSGKDDTEVKIRKNTPKKELEADNRNLLKFFKNLYEDISKKKTTKDYKVTLTDLTKYLIGVELLLEFGGKTKKDDKEKTTFTYLHTDGTYTTDNVKGICLLVIGDFLRLLQKGFKDYDFDYTKKKFTELVQDALICTIACILNVNWKSNENKYTNTLLLNTLHCFGSKTTENLDENLEKIISKVIEEVNNLKQPSQEVTNLLNFFSNTLCLAYKTAVTKREEKKFDTDHKIGDIIYCGLFSEKSNLGFDYCYIHSDDTENGQQHFSLSRPGFLWNDKKQDFTDFLTVNDNQKIPITKTTILKI